MQVRARLEAGDLLRQGGGGDVAREELLQPDALRVVRHVEAEGRPDRPDQRVRGAAAFDELRGRTDEPLVPAELAQRRTADPFDGVGERRVREAGEVLLQVLLL